MTDKTTDDSLDAGLDAGRIALTSRLKALRHELFGERGGPELARILGLPVRTMYNYESGVVIPGEVLVLLVERTDVSPTWLLTGREPMLGSGTE
ncbi:helix-turn-helix domain-containing protein [Isosphaeraceae bacterium EP7]